MGSDRTSCAGPISDGATRLSFGVRNPVTGSPGVNVAAVTFLLVLNCIMLTIYI